MMSMCRQTPAANPNPSGGALMDKILAWLKSLTYKFRVWLVHFMTGRHGVDELSIFTLSASILISLAGSLFGSLLLILLGYAGEIYTLFRIFSKNNAKRAEENRKYTTWSRKTRFNLKAFLLRLKMRREYKYFRCPGCKSLMRLKRGQGEVEMDCPKCHTRFKQKS